MISTHLPTMNVNSFHNKLSSSAWRAQLDLPNRRLELQDGGTGESVEGLITLHQEEHELGYRLQLSFTPNKPTVIESCLLEIPWRAADEDFLLSNGFQSWTESHWLHPQDRLPQLCWMAKPLMGYYGDYHIPWLPRKKGHVHSWSWTEWRQAGEEPFLLASLNETTAFTCFQWQRARNCLSVESDCRGWRVTEPVILLDFLVLQGPIAQVYDAWVEALQLPPLKAASAWGWTSWYQHYTHISEQIIKDNLAVFQARERPLDYFQIDDGYQTAVGDWLSIKDNFPRGMKALADDIRATGATPGLWLAPAVADKRSQLIKDHPEWMAKDQRGRPLKAGYNPNWGGWFYALDTEHEGWQQHFKEVFRTVVEEWGYGMIKLDFLYAACIYPTATHTRAQLMHNLLVNLREWAGDAYLLGCGTPLVSGFGLFDYCRIGADIHLQWEHRLLRWFRHRERVSTLVALRSVLGRWPLAGRVWRNDPDVYLLRDENLQLTEPEKTLVHRLNTLLGELLFTSDNPSTYGTYQQQEESWQSEWWGTKVKSVQPQANGHYLVKTAKGNFSVSLQKNTGDIRFLGVEEQ